MVLLGHKGSYEKSNFSGWFVKWGTFYDAMVRYCNHFYPPIYACSDQGGLTIIHFLTKTPIENIILKKYQIASIRTQPKTCYQIFSKLELIKLLPKI